MKQNQKISLVLCLAAINLFLSPVTQAATVNVNLNVTTADEFFIKDSSGTALVGNSLVKIGVFVNTTSGVALSAIAVQNLFNSQTSFSSAVASLLGSFVEIGEARVGQGLANGSGDDGAVLNILIGATTSHPYGTSPYQYSNDMADGTFRRNWLDNTLPIQNGNVGSSPFNNISNTKLNGLAVSLIAFNGSTISGSTELLVARNTVASESLPSTDGDSVTFGLDGSSELIIGTASSAAFQTIPEPSSFSLALLGGAVLIARRLRNQSTQPHNFI